MSSVLRKNAGAGEKSNVSTRKEMSLSSFSHPDPADELEDEIESEQEGLSDAFKQTLGIEESIQEVEEIELAFEETRVETLAPYKFSTFAKQYFSPGQTPSFTNEFLLKPLMPKQDPLDEKVSVALWLAIQRFMGDLKLPSGKQDSLKQKTKVFQGPVMTAVFQSLDKYRRSLKKSDNVASTSSSLTSNQNVSNAEKEYIQIKHKKRSSSKKLFRSSSKSGKEAKDTAPEKVEVKRSQHYSRDTDDTNKLFDYNASPDVMAANLPTQDLDLVHFIIGHAILRKQLRDETYCQLCKALSNNPSATSTARGWLLMILCAGCFQPSNKCIRYVLAFLRGAPSEHRHTSFAAVSLLKRTRTNGTRFHPPCMMEFQALVKNQPVQLPVYLADGRVEMMEADSATTSGEMCQKLALRLGIRDQFGFSIYVSVTEMMSSLGCGPDHIMDALSECDQFVRSQGSNITTPWQILYRKEMFTPWYDPSNDEIATSLIFAQICKGVRREEYRMRSETELARFIARRFYIDNGVGINPGKLAAALADYMPVSLSGGGQKQRDFWMQIVLASFHDLGLTASEVPPILVRDDVVRSAPFKWPLQFSGLFEAYRLAGPHLPRNDLILAVSCLSLSILDDTYRILHSFQLYEIVEVYASRSNKMLAQNFTFSILSGEEFTFICPNTDTVTRLLNHFLEGLRRRSQYAVALQDFILQGEGAGSPFSFYRGDVIELKIQPAAGQVPDWYYGKCERTGLEGPFPFDSVYILPAVEKPPEEFLDMFRLMSMQFTSTLPRRRGMVVLARDEIHKDSVDNMPIESAA